MINSPHLEGAVELDTALLEFSSTLEKRGLPAELKSTADLDKIMQVITNEILPGLKLYEYYIVDVKAQSEAFAQAWTKGGHAASSDSKLDLKSLGPKDLAEAFAVQCLSSDWNQLGPRYHAQLKQLEAVAFVSQLTGAKPGAGSAEQAVAEIKRILDIVNVPRYEQYDQDLEAIVSNTKNRVKYTRIDEHGPKFGPITAK